MAPPSQKDAIEKVLNVVAPEGSRVRVVRNADGSVDGEILIRVGRGDSIEKQLEDVEHGINELGLAKSRKLFYSTGFRWEPRPQEEEKLKYNRYRGLFEQFTRYYGNPQSTVSYTEATLEGMRRRKFRKPIQAILRVHWNKQGIKPGKDK